MTLPFDAGDPLDAAYAKTVAYLRARDPGVVEVPAHAGFGRLVLVRQEETDVIVHVSVDEWTQEGMMATVAEMLQAFAASVKGGKLPAFQVLSPHEIPGPVAFLFGNSKPAHMELFCMAAHPFDAVIAPAQVGELVADFARPLLRQFIGVDVDPASGGAIEHLERILLQEIRPDPDPASKVHEEEFRPERTLVCFGLLFGEALRWAVPDSHWASGDTYPFHLGMLHRKAGREVGSNPIAKVMRLYLSGAAESLTGLRDKLR